MSYLLAQILVCLLIAGLIGAVIGWLLRGGCKSYLRDCEEEWKLKLSSLESEYNNRLKELEGRTDNTYYNSGDKEYIARVDNDLENATLKTYESGVNRENKEDDSLSLTADTNDTSNLSKLDNKELEYTKELLYKKGIKLDDKKIALYSKHGIDLRNEDHLEDDYDIESIDGIDAHEAKLLKSHGIRSTYDLIKNLHPHSEIAKKINLKPESIHKWRSISDIMQVPGINGKVARLLHSVGVNSVSDLANEDSHRLHNRMNEHNSRSHILHDTPSHHKVSRWIAICKDLKIHRLNSSHIGDNEDYITRIGDSHNKNATLKYKSGTNRENKEDDSLGLTADTNDISNLSKLGHKELEYAKELLYKKGIKLDDKKIALYSKHGINLRDEDHLEDDYDIKAVEGIGPKYANKFNLHGIHTTNELVDSLKGNEHEIVKFSQKIKVDVETIKSWISMAELMKLPGVNGLTAELMQTVGVSSLSELAVTNAHSLHSEMEAFNEKSPILPKVPSHHKVSRWIAISKDLKSHGLHSSHTGDIKKKYIPRVNDNNKNSTLKYKSGTNRENKEDDSLGLNAKTNDTCYLSKLDYKELLFKKGVKLDDKKIELYTKHDIDLRSEDHLEDNYDIESIDGIDAHEVNLLKSHGIVSTSDLIKNLHPHSEIAKKTDLKPGSIYRWRSMSNMMQVPGINGKVARLLYGVGVISISDLADEDSHELHNRMSEHNSRSHILHDTPSHHKVSKWIALSKDLKLHGLSNLDHDLLDSDSKVGSEIGAEGSNDKDKDSSKDLDPMSHTDNESPNKQELLDKDSSKDDKKYDLLGSDSKVTSSIKADTGSDKSSIDNYSMSHKDDESAKKQELLDKDGSKDDKKYDLLDKGSSKVSSDISTEDASDKDSSKDVDSIAHPIEKAKNILAKRGMKLDDKKIELYTKHGIDLKKEDHLEDDYDVESIDGIDANEAKLLKSHGIRSTS
ncbi:MAG: hypothetical protein DSZ06_04230, partial [Sulfurospirillum sp.]